MTRSADGWHIALVGTTASGKSAVALELARRDPRFELVSVDSMQVYRGMDVGTAKPTPEERAEVPHHLLDLADPWEDFTVARFQAAFRGTLQALEERGRRALLVGGTGLHLRAVVDDLTLPGQFPEVRAEFEVEGDTAVLYGRLTELDPTAAGRIEPGNRRRILRALEVTVGSGQPFSSFGPGLQAHPPTPYRLLGIDLPAEVVATRIRERLAQQMEAGFTEEVRRLAADPRGMSRTARQALGYRELLHHIEDGVPLDEAREEIAVRTRRFARRQRAWFRRDPRISWFAGTAPEDLVGTLAKVCSARSVP